MIPHADKLRAIAAQHPYPLLFATISGAHLYGFPSPDSDFDLRGVHVLPARELLGLKTGPETIEIAEDRDGMELDLVTHDAGKFFGLVLQRNGYVLEQLFSPLLVQAMPEHETLKAIARKCITRNHAHHYLGFAAGQWKHFHKEEPRRLKPLLYVLRVLLTGIHLMYTGEVEANLLTLNDSFQLAYLPELLKRKLAGPEQGGLSGADIGFFDSEYARLARELELAHQSSSLRDVPEGREELHDLLLWLRGVGPGQSTSRPST
ncbi:MAG: nucleotidyltransferase domain-containing protein [Planctomycetes bacterium]|nr:nucleotidyltransferase domain-containing protein [Planctomycetota bacterium]